MVNTLKAIIYYANMLASLVTSANLAVIKEASFSFVMTTLF